MKMINRSSLSIIVSMLIASATSVLAAESPKFKMTTSIPANLTTPDKVETSIGTLNFFDGVPTKETDKFLTMTM